MPLVTRTRTAQRPHTCNCGNAHTQTVEETYQVNVPDPVLPCTRVRVFCSRGSDSADALVAALADLDVPVARTRQLATVAALRPGTLIVAWGEKVPTTPAGCTVLNGNPLKDKLTELQTLQRAGVAVPQFVTARPTGEGWLARKRMHQAANDLRAPAGSFTPAYWVKKLNIASEYRLHIFNGESLRLGKKVVRAGERNAHPWIRSVETGYQIDYGTTWRARGVDASLVPVRAACKAAVEALGLAFGAVDVGVTTEGAVVVFEVNTAPSLANNNSAVSYAEKIKGLLHGA